MKVNNTAFTVAEYCSQFAQGQIIVNRDYQRSAKVWPAAAKSYLIDTLLLGFPIPKLTLYQRTDLLTRTTIKEIVDGQQRSEAICQFLNGRYRLSSKSPNGGKRFSQLDEAAQQRFLEYPLTVDVLVAATPDEIRQLFRRINSYTVPLNRQETRHAIFQGEFKWFIASQTELYSPALKAIGVFSEAQLTRMADGELLSELVLAIDSGIKTASPDSITNLYERYERTFTEGLAIADRFAGIFDRAIRWEPLHKSPLMKPHHFYALALAITHCVSPVGSLQVAYQVADGRVVADDDTVLAGLGRLAEISESEDDEEPAATGEAEWGEIAEVVAAASPFDSFRRASSEATNTETNRITRFQWYCRALLGEIAL
jgi:hypothetical protein